MKNPELGRGYIDYIEYAEGKLKIEGWLFLPDCSLDSFIMKINQTTYGETRIIAREDVQKVFPRMATALWSGFSFNVPVTQEALKDWVDIDIAGTYQGEETVFINTVYRVLYHASLPEPPANLMQRVANVDNAQLYWCRALKSFGEFLSAIRKYRDINSIKYLLDWGCGCGRVASLFLKHMRISRVYGCDIDKEAVQWCSDHLQSGYFSVINPYPPTRFSDSIFDVVLGYSVFTHLSRDLQLSWLEEIKRIMVPGGLFFASVHGDFAASFAPPHVQQEIAESGVSDSSLDPNLNGIAPEGYYRGVYQSRQYTLEEWGKHIKILDYIDKGMGNFQDLVVMQKEK